MGEILRFTLLYMLTAILQHLYNAADTIVVGNFAGKLALGGVGASAPVISLFLNFIIGLSAGAAILLGQLIGANDRSGIHETVHTSIAIAILGGVIMSVVCIVFARPLLVWLSVDEQIMAEALVYLRIVAIGFVPSLIYNFGSAIMRAKGDTKRPLYIALFSGIINVGLNLFFVCVFRMGAAVIGVCGLRIGWLLSGFKAVGTYASIFWSFPLAWGGTMILLFIMFCIVYRKEKKKVQFQ